MALPWPLAYTLSRPMAAYVHSPIRINDLAVAPLAPVQFLDVPLALERGPSWHGPARLEGLQAVFAPYPTFPLPGLRSRPMDISDAFWPPVRRPGDTLSQALDPSPKYPSPVCPQTYAPRGKFPQDSRLYARI